MQDKEGMMPYRIACLSNRYECFRLLSSLHWGYKKDVAQIKKLGEEKYLKQEMGNRRSQKCVQKEKADSVYNNWLHKKGFDIASACSEPRECGKRITLRATSNNDASCTACRPAMPTHERAHISQTKNVTVHPITIRTHQEKKNLDFVGKPKKMLPYSNYSKCSSKTINLEKGKGSIITKTGSHFSRDSFKSSSSAEPAMNYTRDMKVASDSSASSSRKIEAEYNIPASANVLQLSYHHTGSIGVILPSHSDMAASRDDSDFNVDDNHSMQSVSKAERHDNSSCLHLTKNNFKIRGKSSTIHEVTPLSSLYALPSIFLGDEPLLKEVVERLKHLEGNNNMRLSRRWSYSVSNTSGPSDKQVRRFSLGSTLESDCETYSNNSQLLIELHNALESIGVSEYKTNAIKPSEEQNNLNSQKSLSVINVSVNNSCSGHTKEKDILLEPPSFTDDNCSLELLSGPRSQDDVTSDTPSASKTMKIFNLALVNNTTPLLKMCHSPLISPPKNLCSRSEVLFSCTAVSPFPLTCTPRSPSTPLQLAHANVPDATPAIGSSAPASAKDHTSIKVTLPTSQIARSTDFKFMKTFTEEVIPPHQVKITPPSCHSMSSSFPRSQTLHSKCSSSCRKGKYPFGSSFIKGKSPLCSSFRKGKSPLGSLPELPSLGEVTFLVGEDKPSSINVASPSKTLTPLVAQNTPLQWPVTSQSGKAPHYSNRTTPLSSKQPARADTAMQIPRLHMFASDPCVGGVITTPGCTVYYDIMSAGRLSVTSAAFCSSASNAVIKAKVLTLYIDYLAGPVYISTTVTYCTLT